MYKLLSKVVTVLTVPLPVGNYITYINNDSYTKQYNIVVYKVPAFTYQQFPEKQKKTHDNQNTS